MTQREIFVAPAKDTAETTDLRATVHQIGTAAQIAILLFAAELALETLPPNQERALAENSLRLAALVPAGEGADLLDLANAIQDEDGNGPLYYQQVAPPGTQADVWGAISLAIGYATWHEAVRQGRQPPEIVDSFESPDALDVCVDGFVGVPSLNWTAILRANAWLRIHAANREGGWGDPLRVNDLRQVASDTLRS